MSRIKLISAWQLNPSSRSPIQTRYFRGPLFLAQAVPNPILKRSRVLMYLILNRVSILCPLNRTGGRVTLGI